MNYIYHLNSFLWLLQRESRLTPSHISLYLALFHHWNCNRFQNPFPLYKERLMQISGIGSKTTYNRCLKDLHLFGYIRYDPSLHKNHRPKVSLIRWKINAEEVNRQLSVFPINPPEIKPLTVPDMGHLIARIGTVSGSDLAQPPVNSEPLTGSNLAPNIKQSINNKNLESEAHAPFFFVNDGQGANANTGTSRAAAAPSAGPPPKDDVLKYFTTMNYPEIEALKFFAHYQSTGWQRGGNVSITNWQGAADKWMLNPIINKNDNKTNSYATSKFDQRPGHLNHNNDKSYDDPI